MGDITNYPFGVSSFGVPVLPGGIPPGGTVFFVDQANGSDSNDGLTPGKALLTLSRAHTLMTANQNDTAIIIGSTSSIAVRESATLAWSKSMCHIIGTAVNRVSHRCSIRATSGVNFTPLVNVTASGCIFANFHVFHGYAADTAQIAWQDSGQRNAYYNVHIGGMGTGGASSGALNAGGRSLKLAGGGERYFKDCVIGLDTTDKSTTANAELEIAGAVREIFEDCVFQTYGSGAHAMVLLTATGLDRYALFKNCTFINPIQSATTALTECFSCTAGTSPNGAVILKDPLAYGCGPWEADVETARVIVLGHPTPASTDGSGLAGAPESP